MSIETQKHDATGLLSRIGGIRGLGFYAVVVAVIGLMILFLGSTLPFLFTSWFAAEPGIHHLHEIVFVALLWTTLVGMGAQLYKPVRRVGAIQQALLGTIVITGVNLLTGFFFPPALVLGGLVVAATALHPAGRGVLRVHTAGAVSPLLVGLVVVAAIPLVAYAIDQFALSATGDVHAQLGHYTDMVTLTTIVLLFGLLASTKPIGWRVPLWSAAGLMIVLGLASVLHPTLPSSVGTLWGVLAIGWAGAFVIAGEVSRSEDSSHATSKYV